MQRHELCKVLVRVLVEDGYCIALEEATAISEIILHDLKGAFHRGELRSLLCEHLSLSQTEGGELLSRLGFGDDSHDDDEGPNQKLGTEASQTGHNYGELCVEDPEGTDMLSEGECELCDRFILLTKHHLIPKSTWPRLQTRLEHAAEAKANGDVNKARLLLGDGLGHLLDVLTIDKQTIRAILSVTCNICRPCHSAVHKAHENMELALSFNTIESLLQDKQISGFCKWASKQKPGKYSRKQR